MVDQFSKNALHWLNNGIDLKKINGIGAGFEIQPHNGHYKICMTDEAFETFLKENMRPIARQILLKKNDDGKKDVLLFSCGAART